MIIANYETGENLNLEDMPKSKAEAQNLAIEWQNFNSANALFWSEVIEGQNFFRIVAEKYDLKDEFQENGII